MVTRRIRQRKKTHRDPTTKENSRGGKARLQFNRDDLQREGRRNKLLTTREGRKGRLIISSSTLGQEKRKKSRQSKVIKKGSSKKTKNGLSK